MGSKPGYLLKLFYFTTQNNDLNNFTNTDLDESGSEDEAEITSKKPKKTFQKSKKLATTKTEKPENSDANKQEIPFTFSVPKTSDDLEELFIGRGPKEKAIIGRAQHIFSRILKTTIFFTKFSLF
jgi:hypothetical protein